MKTRTSREPIDPTRIRRITGSFSWIDHRFIPMMVDLSRDENLLYLWLVAVGDRRGMSFYSDEKTASCLKITVGEIAAARAGLIAKDLVAYREGVSQVLSLPPFPAAACAPVSERIAHVIERPRDARPLPPGCREALVPSDRAPDRALAKRGLQDLLRQLEGAPNETRLSARSAP
jgi:hypothetical protein